MAHFPRLRRTAVVAACLLSSGLAPVFGLIGLNVTVSRYGTLALLVLISWLLALAALGVLSVGWILDRPIGRTAALACCGLGLVAMFALPVLWPKDFPGSLLFELLVTLPSVLLATYLTRFHSATR